MPAFLWPKLYPKGGLVSPSAQFTASMRFRPLAALETGVHWVASLVARACEAVIQPPRPEAETDVETRAAAAKAAHAEEEAATRRYLYRFTRFCPGCQARIVKEEGCDHMLCRCGKAFNWSEARYG